MSLATSEPEETEPEKWKAYAGRWIACVGNRLVGQGGTPQQALQAARAARYKETPQVVYMPTTSPLSFGSLFEEVRALLPADEPVYLVGGAVRDALLGKPAHDLDFALQHNAVRVARHVADALGGAFYLLDDQRGTGRVIINTGGVRSVLDFALLRGPDLDSDLRGRDYTINAMAVEAASPQKLLDPLGGAADLYKRVLRACSESAIVDDPVRILRGVRLSVDLKLHILPETIALTHAALDKLSGAPVERMRDELFRMLDNPHPAAAIRLLDAMGALPAVLPELLALKNLEQSPPHIADVWEHTLMTAEKLEELLEILGDVPDAEKTADLTSGLTALRLGRFRDKINSHLAQSLNPNRSLKSLLVFAALYHDTGKQTARQVDASGRIRAWGHEKEGEQMAVTRARLLALSNAEADRVSVIVRHHMRVHLLSQRNETPSRRAIYRFFRDCGEAGVDVCLVSLADALATFGYTMPQDLWAAYLEVVRALFEAWWEEPREKVLPEPLMNGNALQTELGMPPGPEIGRLLEALREAQVSGKIHDREEARAFARAWLDDERK